MLQQQLGQELVVGATGIGGGGGGKEPGRPQIFIGKVPYGLPLGLLEAQLVPFGASNVRQLEGKGCAFADFNTWAEAEHAIVSLNGLQLIEGHEGINVKHADQKNGQKQATPKPKVFVGGLSPSVTEPIVSQYCAQFGIVEEAKIYAKNSGAPPCAFVTFASAVEAEGFIAATHGQENELAAAGKTLNVRFADNSKGQVGAVVGGPVVGAVPAVGALPPPPLPGGGGPRVGVPPAMQGMAAGGMPGMGLPGPMASGGGGNSIPHAQMLGSTVSRPSSGGPGAPPLPSGCSRKVFIGGLPEVANEDFAWGMMAAFGEVLEAKVHKTAGKAPCGFIRFAQQAEADFAVGTLSQFGRYTVKFADDKSGGQAGAGSAKRSFQAAFDGGHGGHGGFDAQLMAGQPGMGAGMEHWQGFPALPPPPPAAACGHHMGHHAGHAAMDPSLQAHVAAAMQNPGLAQQTFVGW